MSFLFSQSPAPKEAYSTVNICIWNKTDKKYYLIGRLPFLYFMSPHHFLSFLFVSHLSFSLSYCQRVFISSQVSTQWTVCTLSQSWITLWPTKPKTWRLRLPWPHTKMRMETRMLLFLKCLRPLSQYLNEYCLHHIHPSISKPLIHTVSLKP